MIRHVILDRDGVLNEEGESPVIHWDQWKWIEGAQEAICSLEESGHTISVVTNQSCIGRGIATQEQVDKLHKMLTTGWPIARVLVCPHTPEDHCECRKPKPGLILKAIRESGIPASETLFIGNSLTDLVAGKSAGVEVVHW